MTNHHVMMSGKIHRATVTVADLNYEDSISIYTQLLHLANIAVGEQVSIYTVCTGARLGPYAITDAIGEVCLNGAAAVLVTVRDIVINVSYPSLDDHDLASHTPRISLVDGENTPAARAESWQQPPFQTQALRQRLGHVER